ncbi:MAG: hypothetical protein HRU38_20460 [Saccharospirillaceae bacterium]|nr:hypothetical protein [Pseudomonadales bacterium]NRB81006.1 hypothetical protein [Saccharospirillaceae bacterium]
MKYILLFLITTLLYSCKTTPVIIDNSDNAHTKSAALYLKNAYYIPILEPEGINMLPEGFNKTFTEKRELISGFEIKTNLFKANLVRITTKNRQIDSNSQFGDAWEFRGSLDGKINSKLLGQSGFSSSYMMNSSENNNDIFILPNVDQLIFDYKTVNMKPGKFTDVHSKNYVSLIHIEVANISPKSIEKFKWKLDPDNDACSKSINIDKPNIKFKFNKVNKTFYATISSEPLVTISFTFEELLSKYNKYPDNFLSYIYTDVNLAECSFFLTLKRESDWDFLYENWKTLYIAYPDESNSFEELRINLPNLKSTL